MVDLDADIDNALKKAPIQNFPTVLSQRLVE